MNSPAIAPTTTPLIQPAGHSPSFVNSWPPNADAIAPVDGIPPAGIWGRFNGEEWNIGNNRPTVLPALLRECFGAQNRSTISLMCGKYSFCQAELGVDINAVVLGANQEISHALVHNLDDPKKPLPVANASFGRATLLSGIAYLHHPEHLFAEVSRILKPGGEFYVGFDGCAIDSAAPIWEILEPEERTQRVTALMAQANLMPTVRRSADVFAVRDGIVSWPYFILGAERKI